MIGRVASVVLAVAFAGTAAVSAWLLLPACAVVLPGLGRCPDPAKAAAVARLATLDGHNADLTREVAALERALAAMQCTADLPPVVPDPPPVAALPAPPLPAPAPIDPDAWARRDLGVLDGCWQLDSTYATRNVRTGEVTTYTEWRMCFDASGTGTAEMLGSNGVTCAGPVRGAFAADGQLSVTEPGNLGCSDDSFIYRRDLVCALSGDGGASCAVSQAEVGSTSTVRLRRAEGANP
ncbi:MAG: hypothetical protein MUF73_09195 [Rhodobacteraceae bacterium]|jgi:hypothetical protein|nr:hypothetical protein [Paracoccaceae bacterium]